MSEGTVEQTFQRRDCTVQPYCRQGQHIPLDNPLHMRLEEGHRLMLHDQHWVTEQGFWNGIKKGLTKVFEKGSQAYAWVRQQLGHGRYLGF